MKEVKKDRWENIPDNVKGAIICNYRTGGDYFFGGLLSYIENRFPEIDDEIFETKEIDMLRIINEVFLSITPLELCQSAWDKNRKKIGSVLDTAKKYVTRLLPDSDNRHVPVDRECEDAEIIDISQNLSVFNSIRYYVCGNQDRFKTSVDVLLKHTVLNISELLNSENAENLITGGTYLTYPAVDRFQPLMRLANEEIIETEPNKTIAKALEKYCQFLSEIKPKQETARFLLQGRAELTLRKICEYAIEILRDEALEAPVEVYHELLKDIEVFEDISENSKKRFVSFRIESEQENRTKYPDDDYFSEKRWADAQALSKNLKSLIGEYPDMPVMILPSATEVNARPGCDIGHIYKIMANSDRFVNKAIVIYDKNNPAEELTEDDCPF